MGQQCVKEACERQAKENEETFCTDMKDQGIGFGARNSSNTTNQNSAGGLYGSNTTNSQHTVLHSGNVFPGVTAANPNRTGNSSSPTVPSTQNSARKSSPPHIDANGLKQGFGTFQDVGFFYEGQFRNDVS
jgi:hypothetical protein